MPPAIGGDLSYNYKQSIMFYGNTKALPALEHLWKNQRLATGSFLTPSPSLFPLYFLAAASPN